MRSRKIFFYCRILGLEGLLLEGGAVLSSLEVHVQTDAELVKAVLAGERRAFAELVKRYEQAVRAVAVDVLGDIHAAEDVAQDCFVIAYQKLNKLRKPSAFGYWLLKVARREAISRGRSGVKMASLEESKVAAVADCDGQLDEGLQEVLAAVMKLPSHEQQVVMLRYFNGQSIRGIAEVTGRGIGTVSKQLSRAHERLREMLKGIEL